MEICFESERASLQITWLTGNGHLSVVEYIEYWYSIQRHVEVLKPVVLLIDAEQLEYRSLPEVQEIFNRISELINPQNFAIVASNNSLGQTTLKNLLMQCSQNGHIIFENSKSASIWLLSNESAPYFRM